MISITRHQSDLSFAFREAGEGEPLILLHGVGMQSAAWEQQMTTLSAAYRVIALDLPGHGESEAITEDAGLEDFVDWLAKVVQKLNLASVNVAGHSMGAMIAGGFAVSYPGLVRRVALLNGVYRRSDEARQAIEGRVVEMAGGQADRLAPIGRWFEGSAGDRQSIESAKQRTVTWLEAMDASAYLTAYRAFAEGDPVFADHWPEVTCPALFLTGADDPNSTPDMAEAMAAAAQDGEVCVIPGHRHMVNMTAADTVNQALLNWLARPLVSHLVNSHD